MSQAERLDQLRRARPRSRFLRWSIGLMAALAIGVWFTGEIAVDELFSSRRADNLERFLQTEAKPAPLRDAASEVSLGEWFGQIWESRGRDGLLATFWISWLAMALAGVYALIVAPLCTRTLMRHDPYLGGGVGRGWRIFAGFVRTFNVVLRAVPEYIWAFLLLAVLGRSAWPAVLALAIHNAGIVARLGADVTENLGPRPGQALRQLGATRAQTALAFLFPQAFGRFLLFWFYRYETCVREATVLGMLGVVSLGYWIRDANARDRYDEMLVLIGLGAVLVLAADAVSWLARGWVRRAGLAGGRSSRSSLVISPGRDQANT
jgi:phosphonate transport system permease protein